MHTYSFSDFKQQINLTQYAAYLGYEIDPKKSTRSSIVMRSGADKIIISRRGTNWVYFSVSDDHDNGTIVNFIQNRTHKTIGEIGRELQEWVGGAVTLPEPKRYVQDVEEQNYDPARVTTIFKRCRVAHNHAYLEEGRGIPARVLQSERFKGRIYTDRYGNAVFPHYNEKSICGLELKDAQKAVFVQGSEKTLWRSNVRAGDDILIISEAVIDALSYAVLFPMETALYAATGGGMSPEQAEIIKSAVSRFTNLKRIILITDNDTGGDRLATKIQSAIQGSSFTGEIIRHSPQPRGADWNNILNPKP